jgi:hypothetical protein
MVLLVPTQQRLQIGRIGRAIGGQGERAFSVLGSSFSAPTPPHQQAMLSPLQLRERPT